MKEIAKIVWHENDLLDALVKNGYEPSQENIHKLLFTRIGRDIENASTATGWEIINDAVRSVEGLVKKSE